MNVIMVSWRLKTDTPDPPVQHACMNCIHGTHGSPFSTTLSSKLSQDTSLSPNEALSPPSPLPAHYSRLAPKKSNGRKARKQRENVCLCVRERETQQLLPAAAAYSFMYAQCRWSSSHSRNRSVRRPGPAPLIVACNARRRRMSWSLGSARFVRHIPAVHSFQAWDTARACTGLTGDTTSRGRIAHTHAATSRRERQARPAKERIEVSSSNTMRNCAAYVLG